MDGKARTIRAGCHQHHAGMGEKGEGESWSGVLIQPLKLDHFGSRRISPKGISDTGLLYAGARMITILAGITMCPEA